MLSTDTGQSDGDDKDKQVRRQLGGRGQELNLVLLCRRSPLQPVMLPKALNGRSCSFLSVRSFRFPTQARPSETWHILVEEGVFPSARAEDPEEERYVVIAITRRIACGAHFLRCKLQTPPVRRLHPRPSSPLPYTRLVAHDGRRDRVETALRVRQRPPGRPTASGHPRSRRAF